MNKKEIIKKTEEYVKKTMAPLKDEAHGYRHVDRVRKWAIKIGQAEGGVDLFLLEIAALLHDVGKFKEPKIDHYTASEQIARKFLNKLNFFSPDEINLVCRGIKLHGRGGKEKFVQIIKDADMMELWGAAAVARAFSYFYDKPYFIDKSSFKSKAWTQEKINKNINTRPWEKSVVDNLMFNLDVYNDISTKTARRLAKEKVEYLKEFIRQLKKETIDLK